jgi:DNA polymerase-3 subunit beta
MVKEEILTDVEGADIEIDFNVRYFIEALKCIDDETILVSFNSSLHSATIRPVDGDKAKNETGKFAYMLLALRV